MKIFRATAERSTSPEGSKTRLPHHCFSVDFTPGSLYASRDIAFVPNSNLGPLIAGVDAQDEAVSLDAYRDGGFVRVGSLTTGSLPAQIISVGLALTLASAAYARLTLAMQIPEARQIEELVLGRLRRG